MNKENNRLFLNGKPVHLFNLDDLLKGYDPIKEGDVWNEVECDSADNRPNEGDKRALGAWSDL